MRLVVPCKRFAPHLRITSPELQRFVGSAKVLHASDVALYVATCRFTPDALSIADETGITAVHRGLLERWDAGDMLAVLKQEASIARAVTRGPKSQVDVAASGHRHGRGPRSPGRPDPGTSPHRSSCGGVRRLFTSSTRTSFPHTTYR